MASTPAASASAATETRAPIDRLIAGGAAGALSRFTTAPIDRVKLLIQVNATSYGPPGVPPCPQLTPSSAWSVASRIAKQEGAVALWRGTGAAVVRILPYSATTFAVFPAYVDALNAALGTRGDDAASGRTVAARFLAGALAGTTATVITYPLDLLHARVSAHTPASAGSGGGVAMRDHLRVLLRSGGVRGLYSGIGPTLVGIVPYGGVSFATFESLKALYRRRELGDDSATSAADSMPTTHKLLAGGASGFLAQTVTYPLHVVRRRMQVYGGEKYSEGLFQSLKTIYATEGIKRGLFRGVGLTWIKAPVAAAVGFTANDALQSAVPETRRKASALFGDQNVRERFSKEGRVARVGDAKAANVNDSPSPVTYIERRSVPIGADATFAAKSSALESLAAGGVAGAAAKTVIAPADRVKIIFQVDPNRRFSVRDAFGVAKDIAQREGFLGLWRGNGVMMARVVPYAGVSFMTYPRFETAARRAKKKARDAFLVTSKKLYRCPASATDETETANENASDVTTRFVAGSAAGATATAMTYPLDLMRARYAAAGAVPGVQKKPTAATGWRLFRDVRAVFRAEGVRGLYGGMTPTLLGIVPYAGISFATFETLKSRYGEARAGEAARGGQSARRDANANEPEMPVALRLLFGGVAGLFAQSVTYPLDIVRRRIQVVGAAGGYVSPWRALVDIGRTEGLRNGLYKGVTMNWLKGPVSVAVSFFVNDSVKAYFREQRER